jgi:hypothetical protein
MQMLKSDQIEELISLIASMEREAIVSQFRSYPASFPVDFTHEYLEHQPLERLQHLFLALCIEQKRMPEIAASEAA